MSAVRLFPGTYRPDIIFLNYGVDISDFRRILKRLNNENLKFGQLNYIMQLRGEYVFVAEEIANKSPGYKIICPSQAGHTLWRVMEDLNISRSLNACEDIIKSLHGMGCVIRGPEKPLEVSPGSGSEFYVHEIGWIEKADCLKMMQHYMEASKPSNVVRLPFPPC